MNSVIENLMNRKSVRVFEDREISRKDKETILHAAFAAPSAGCQQMYTILDITDQKLKDTLSETCDHQPFIAKAKMVLIFCTDYQKWYDAFCLAGCATRTPGAGDFLLATEDAAIAAQNAVTAADSLGIGSCYIGDIMEHYEIHKELLHLPDYVFPSLMIVFGYPTEQQKNRPKPKRADLGFLVHENTYRPLTPEELKHNLSRHNEKQTFEEWMQAFCSRKYEADFSKEMTRSVEEILKKFK